MQEIVINMVITDGTIEMDEDRLYEEERDRRLEQKEDERQQDKCKENKFGDIEICFFCGEVDINPKTHKCDFNTQRDNNCRDDDA